MLLITLTGCSVDYYLSVDDLEMAVTKCNQAGGTLHSVYYNERTKRVGAICKDGTTMTFPTYKGRDKP